MKNRKILKINMDQYYGITETEIKGKTYVYLRYRNGKIKERTPLPSNFHNLSKALQQREYKLAKEILDTKLGLSKEENKDMRKVHILRLIEKYLFDFYENHVKNDVNKQVTFDSTEQVVKHRIERHEISKCTVAELVSNDKYVKEYFRESREGFFCKAEEKNIKPVSKSSIDKEVQLLIKTLKFARFEKKWISADDYETLIYQIEKYRAVGTYSKKKKTKILSAYEFVLFRKEILERQDTLETYPALFEEELKNREISIFEKKYIMCLYELERRKVYKEQEALDIPNKKSIEIEKLINIYKDIEKTVKQHLETGFMKEQPDLHYPIIRYYRQNDGSLSTEKNKTGLADFYVINRKNKKHPFHYYYGDGSLNALFLLFIINTGLRFNEGRSLKVSDLKYREIHTSSDTVVPSYYICLQEQVQSVMERDEFGNVIRDEDNRIRKITIITDPKTITSVREIPLNDTAIKVLKIIQDIAGTVIFNEDGSISSRHDSRYVFVNYKKHENPSGKNLGHEGVFLKDFKTNLTYGKLRDDILDETDLLYRLRDVKQKDDTKTYYYEQITDIKRRILEGEVFNWEKQVYVIKPPALLSNSNVNKTLKRILSNMRVENYEEFTVHDLRRTTSSLMAEKGHNTLDIKHILGHAEKSSVTEDVYIMTNYLPALSAMQTLDNLGNI